MMIVDDDCVMELSTATAVAATWKRQVERAESLFVFCYS